MSDPVHDVETIHGLGNEKNLQPQIKLKILNIAGASSIFTHVIVPQHYTVES